MHSPQRRKFLALAPALALPAGLLAREAAASGFPSRAITVVVPTAAGGAADLSARILVDRMGAILGTPMVIENVPAAGGIVATRRVAAAQPDGHTLLNFGTKAAIAESLFKDRPYNLARDIAPIGLIGMAELALFVDKGSTLKSVGELAERIRSQPGKVTVGVGDTVGGIQHLGAELLKASLKGDFLIVPYGSAGKLIAAVRGGEVDAALELVPPMLPQVKSGDMRALAAASAQRSSYLPEVPTLTESGIANAEMAVLSMLGAPAGTPSAVMAKLNEAMRQALGQREVQEALRNRGSVPGEGMDPAQARRLMQAQVNQWREAVQQAKVTLR